jgi:ribosomal protein S25
MKIDQKAVLARAEREGLTPSEVAAELLTHDLVSSALSVIRGHAVAFKNMSQQQQDDAIQQLADDTKKAVDNAVRIIAGAGSKVVRMKLKKVAIGTNYQIQGTADRTEENLHALCDKAQDQSDVLIILFEQDYHQGLDLIEGEKDQKALPLEGEKPAKPEKKPRAKSAGEIAKKIVELPPGFVDQARAFVVEFQNGTIAGLQNQLKCSIDKARAAHDVLVSEGLLSEEADEHGNRQFVRQQEAAKQDGQEEQPKPSDDDDVVDASWEQITAVDDEIYVKAKTAVLKDRRVSVTFIKGETGAGDELAQAILARLEADGVVSEVNEMGGRTILID